MKKVLAILLVLALVFSFAACGNKEDASSNTGTSSTITTTEGDETSSSEATNTESTGDATTSDTTSGSSSEQNTSKPTESSKPADTNKPTTSTTPSTSKPSTETHTHSWGNWRIETKALVGKDGTEKRTCSGCKETETRSTTKDAIFNSFFNEYLQEYFVWCVQSEKNTRFHITALFKCGDLIARDLCYNGTAEEIATSSIPVNDYYNALKEYFVLNDVAINQLKAARNGDAYPVTFDGFTPGTLYYVAGYSHQSQNIYTVYYDCDDEGMKPIAVTLEYNLLNGKPNRYISIEKVNSIPSNITQ